MPVQPWVTGPNFIFLAPASEPDQALYFGTASVCPKPRIVEAWKPIGSSYRGLSQASEHAFMGMAGDVGMLMSRWDQTVLGIFVQPVAAVGAGSFSAADIGTLQMAQKEGITVSVVFPYSEFLGQKAMPAGYRFLMCRLNQLRPLDAGGTEGEQMFISFDASAVYIPNQLASKPGTWVLYDYNVPPVPKGSM